MLDRGREHENHGQTSRDHFRYWPAGTTFLVQLLTELEMDTGFHHPSSGVYANCNAGMERDIFGPDAPYIIKTPLLCDRLDDVVRHGIVIDHAIIPVRDLYAAAESGRAVTREADPLLTGRGVPGGLWDTDTPEQQEAVLALYFHKLIESDVPGFIPPSFRRLAFSVSGRLTRFEPASTSD